VSSVRAQANRITAPIDLARPTTLRKNDRGSVEEDFPLPAMTLFFKRSAGQQADLRQLLEDQQNPGSPLYRRWLTPEMFGDRFGLSADDSAAMANWLRSQGFVVNQAARSRTWIAFSGTARQIQGAFHTEIHHYLLDGKSDFANAAEPSIPAALAEIVSGMYGLDDLSPEPVEARMTSSDNMHTLAPDDLATIYDIAPLYQSGIDGSGQTIAVMGGSQFDASGLADVAAFRSQVHLPPNVPQIISATGYPEPGVTDNSEAHLDIEWAGAIARNAKILFVSADTFLDAVLFAVDNNLAPVITMSANNGCEAANMPATISSFQAVAQQANAQGMTWVVSGSDAGPASCDPNGAPIAMSGLGVRFPASIPEVTAVGGTEFNEQSGSYWSTTNTGNGASALSYILEMVWNDAAALSALWAGGGGASFYFQKPVWQAGPGVPNIPSGLVGVTQINFQIPQNVPMGPQPVVVTIGA
jgi:subtilase family serine protease